LFLALVGPGVIVAAADNDAGGIATYSIAGADYGYALLWLVVAVSVILAVVQEMCARMGAVTEKGLAELIREEYGVGWTVSALAAMVVANTMVAASNFAGVAASLELIRVPVWLSVLAAAAFLVAIVSLGTFHRVERVFLVFCLLYVTYIIAGILAKPDWGEVVASLARPTLRFERHFLMLSVALIGTTVTPWMQFVLQSTVVEKGVKLHRYRYQRWDVILGALATGVICVFIVVTTGAVLHPKGIQIAGATEAAQALRPLAGRYCEWLFAAGLLNASLLGAAVVTLTTAYTICEAFGWEMGLNRRWREASAFYGVILTTIIVAAAIVVFWRGVLFHLMLLAQVLNGILLPVVLVFVYLLVNNLRVMGPHRSSALGNLVALGFIAAVVLCSLAMLVAGLAEWTGVSPGG